MNEAIQILAALEEAKKNGERVELVTDAEVPQESHAYPAIEVPVIDCGTF